MIQVTAREEQTRPLLDPNSDIKDFTIAYGVLMEHDWEIVDPNNPTDIHYINLEERGWTWGFDQAKRRLGVCKGRQKRINISSYLLKGNKHQIVEFEDTIRHEIAHAIDREIRGHSAHDWTWKEICKQVGARPERCGKTVKHTDPKYILECPSCGREAKRYRKPRSGVACGACCKKHNGGKYTSEFEMNVKQLR